MASMDTLIDMGKRDVQEKLKEGTADITRKGADFQGVKDQLTDMPGGLDADLQQLIKDAVDQGRADAAADIEETKKAVIDLARKTKDSISGDIKTKISDNNTAKGKLDGVNSRYGKGAIDRAKSDIADNTRRGEDYLKVLQDVMEKADQDIMNVKDKL